MRLFLPYIAISAHRLARDLHSKNGKRKNRCDLNNLRSKVFYSPTILSRRRVTQMRIDRQSNNDKRPNIISTFSERYRFAKCY